MSAPTDALRLNDDAMSFIEDMQARYPNKRATILHVLWEIQKQESWVSEEWMAWAGEICEVPLSHVLSVVTFYTMFQTSPPGKHHIEVCRNISCVIMGAEKLMTQCRSKLGLKPGERSEDGRYSYDEVECLAACSWAPMMAINGRYYENLDSAKVDEIIDGLE